MPPSLWGRPRAHNIRKFPLLVALCWILGGIAWEIQVLSVPFVVLWRHSLGGYVGGGSDGVGLVWGTVTCEALLLHIL